MDKWQGVVTVQATADDAIHRLRRLCPSARAISPAVRASGVRGVRRACGPGRRSVRDRARRVRTGGRRGLGEAGTCALPGRRAEAEPIRSWPVLVTSVPARGGDASTRLSESTSPGYQAPGCAETRPSRAGSAPANTMPLEAAIRRSPCVRWPPGGTPCCHRPPRGGSSWPAPAGSRPAAAPAPGRSLTGREARVLACPGEGLPGARPGCACPQPGSRATPGGCWTGWAAPTAPGAACSPATPRVSSAGSPGRRSCGLEVGLGARQAGLRPSPGRSCPPGAAGLTGPPRRRLLRSCR